MKVLVEVFAVHAAPSQILWPPLNCSTKFVRISKLRSFDDSSNLLSFFSFEGTPQFESTFAVVDMKWSLNTVQALKWSNEGLHNPLFKLQMVGLGSYSPLASSSMASNCTVSKSLRSARWKRTSSNAMSCVRSNVGNQRLEHERHSRAIFLAFWLLFAAKSGTCSFSCTTARLW